MEDVDDATQATQVTPVNESDKPSELATQTENVYLKLVMTRMGDGKTQVIPLTRDIHNGFWRFGRHRSCEVVIGGPRISNFHFEIYEGHASETENRNNVIFLHDHSSNGTFLNLERLPKNGRSILSHGDEIRVGLGVPKDEIRFLCQIPYNRSESMRKELVTSNVNRYEVLRTLGTGTFAVVKLAVDLESGECYAIKVINKKKILLTSSEKRATEMFQREIEILKTLHHPGVVQCREVFETDEELFIVMEYVEGGDLMDFLIANGSIDEQDCKPLLKEILETLIYLHECGIAHRDIKPENILITKDFHLKLSDFGLAKVIHGRGTFFETFCGTMGYLAPEILQSKTAPPEGGYDNKVDIWSLGCVLYVTLTATIPFAAPNQEESIKLINKADFPMSPLLENEISPEGIDLITQMFQLDPEKRISEKEALDHPWFKKELSINPLDSPSLSECGHESTEQIQSPS
ncbi:CAMK/RAD53 protein kinase Cds1 [Schizosaccharomyces cryophilus OY26]|uniref:CAMK/RAD53 protein kinase Cds1 n=1 Tax=Schizosaccharomyces cryophilus (strain OY26 / ATCC MYA-4695 / CBS 11777 / NBRC 106824 / NRRL Y48691) TaxID=653667 RepID=S9VPJ7_SCHCR|nr:CAMK/RAD53 protein kinase Cds1 [Schizosaccharomyces cryophilus OY26]EPY49848.1 CAMK/RAD53 protein kinase Cds1 [Schizosaccharomyces cryophilus OY26]